MHYYGNTFCEKDLVHSVHCETFFFLHIVKFSALVLEAASHQSWQARSLSAVSELLSASLSHTTAVSPLMCSAQQRVTNYTILHFSSNTLQINKKTTEPTVKTWEGVFLSVQDLRNAPKLLHLSDFCLLWMTSSVSFLCYFRFSCCLYLSYSDTPTVSFCLSMLTVFLSWLCSLIMPRGNH